MARVLYTDGFQPGRLTIEEEAGSADADPD